MLLFQKRFHEGLVSGRVTTTFRRWERPHVKPGGRYRCHPIGVLEVDAVDQVPVGAITAAEAQQAGFASRDELVAYLAEMGPLPETVWRIRLHHGGDGDRVEVALDDKLGKEDVAAIARKLERMGDWVRPTLAMIRKHPRVAASKLAAKLGRETAPFKIDVRKLKKLGLTQSFEVGYEISPRGKAFLRRWRPTGKSAAASRRSTRAGARRPARG